MKTKAEKQFGKDIQGRFDEKQNEMQRFPATFGDADGNVIVPGYPNYHYCKIGDKVIPVFNNRIPAKNGVAIWVGFDSVDTTKDKKPKKFQVLATRSEDPNGGQGAQLGYAPANRYRYMARNGGGIDPLFLEKRAWLPLRVSPTSPLSMSVHLYEGVVWNGVELLYIAPQDVDLTAHIPSISGKAAYVLLTIDNTGTIIQTKGSEVDIDVLTPVGDEFANVPPIPADTVEVLIPVRAYNGQTVVREARVNSDFAMDLRALFQTATNTAMPYLGSPTNRTLEDDFTATRSSGVIDGTLTYVSVGSTAVKISVAAGDGYIRTTNDQQGALKICHWDASADLYTFSAPAAGQENTIFIGIDYNSGTPTAVAHGSLDWNYHSNFPLARCSYDGTTMRIFQTLAHAEDTANLTRRRFRLTMPLQREEPPEGVGGIEASSSGVPAARSLAMSSGKLWHGFNEYPISTLASGTVFDTHYQRAGGGFTSTIGVTQWPNTQYDDGSGTLATMTAAKYACLWIYVDASDGSMDVIYGRGEYTSTTLAQAEAKPTVPAHLQYHGKLIARLIFQKSAATPSLLESAWTSIFAAGSGGGLSTVEADGSLTGDGTSSTPLSTASGATTATAAGTTTLTVDSLRVQEFTGTTTQIVAMPDVTTLRLGQEYVIINNSTGIVTVKSSGLNSIVGIQPGAISTLRCILITGTTAASWKAVFEISSTQLEKVESAIEKYPFNARLTLETGVAFSTTAQTAKTELFLTQYNGDQLSLYNGSSRWISTTLSSDVSIKGTDAQTGTTTNGNKIISGLTDTSQLVVGMQITGTNVGVGSVIATIDSATQVTGTVNSTGSAPNTMTFKLPPSTVYDVFCFTSTSTAKLELVAGTATRTTQNGIEVKTGETTRRLVGTVMTTATAGQFEVSQTYCSISNRYNPLRHGLYSCPGYNNNSSNTTYATTSTTFVEANGGTGSRLNFVLCKATLVELQMKVTAIATAQAIAAIGIDTITDPNTSCAGPSAVFSPFFDSNDNNGVPLAIGSHYAALLIANSSAGTLTVYADIGTTRSGASQDSRTTWVRGTIMM